MAASASRNPLDPVGRIHLPIGLPNTLDALKTFVEAEGCFSPGFGSYGLYFAVFDSRAGALIAPTQEQVRCERGLAPGGHPIPWTEWRAGEMTVRTEVCQVAHDSESGPAHLVAARAALTNRGAAAREPSFCVALRPLGPAGFAVRKLEVSPEGDALLCDGRTALVAETTPDEAGVSGADDAAEFLARGDVPPSHSASSEAGCCSGALLFRVKLAPGETRALCFVCPVLPGRRAAGHRWDGVSRWAQLDLAEPNPPKGGVLQPDLGLKTYRNLRAETLFSQARAYWERFAAARLELPDARWNEAFVALTAHAALAMNEGAPDVSVVNYNVFNRDGVYVADMLLKAGRNDLAEEALDYFLSHPFNGRVQPEADNPGQILWAMGRYWLFTRDRRWLGRVYSAVRKLAALIEYCRTTAGPHWVQTDALLFGDEAPPARRKLLEPGACDGKHPEYTEAFDVAGLRAASELAEAMERTEEAGRWRGLAERLFEQYEQRFGAQLAREYGGYCVLWPCRLYPLRQGRAFEQFRDVGARKPDGWRYFPLAAAHQGLLAGRREAGYGTVMNHLDHPQMRGWYLLDEGGRSGSGGWGRVLSRWDGSVAMPHGWAIAELQLLLRDCLVFEDGGRLILLAGVPPEWFSELGGAGMKLSKLPTHFGPLDLAWERTAEGARVKLEGAAPPRGFVLRLPPELKASAQFAEQEVAVADGDLPLPSDTRAVELRFAAAPAAR